MKTEKSKEDRSAEVPEIEFYRKELGRALTELEFGVERYCLLHMQADEQNGSIRDGTTDPTRHTTEFWKQAVETGKGRAIAMIQVLEGQQVFVECVNDGFRTIKLPSFSSFDINMSFLNTKPSSSNDGSEGKTYDTLDSLLLNLSPGFMKRANERLEEKLWSVFTQRQTNEANEREEGE